MRIIEKGKLKEFEEKCSYCDTSFAYTTIDLYGHKDYPYVECPTCGKNITVNYAEVWKEN